MVTTTDSFITQMKLRALREQRSRLLRAYHELRQEVALQPTDAGRLEVLYEGLRQVTFATQQLHPDVANLEPLLERTNGEPISRETIAFWHERLEKELTSGQLRSEIVYIFGSVLEEWAAGTTETVETSSQREQLRAELVERLLRPAESGRYVALLDTLLADCAFSDKQDRAQAFKETVGTHLQEGIEPPELAVVLRHLSSSPHHAPLLRKQAQRFLADLVLQKELADALTIMLAHLDEWQRPQEGIVPRPLWTLNKWRLCLDDDLPAACFLEILGQRWQSTFQRFFSAERVARLKQLRSQHLSPLAAYTAQLLSTVNQGLRLSSLTEVDIWEQAPAPKQQSAMSLQAYLRLRAPGSIFERRLQLKSELHDLSTLSGYDALHAASSMEKALTLIHAEIELARTAPSPTPLHLLKLDFKDFYPGLSHKVLLHILEQYGLSASQRAFFHAFLHVPLQQNGQVVISERGIPNYHRLSDLLGELVLGLFEQYVQREARVQIFRLVDDICLLTTSADEMFRAWQAARTFCEAFGLVLNEEKCGSICIGGKRLLTLPDAQPSWLLLTLDGQGQWNVNWSAFETYLEGARRQVAHTTSLVALIEIYNTHLKYLVKALAMRVDLGSAHRGGISTAMERFSQTFFGDGQGVVERVRQVIRERFLDGTSATHIPEAWLYWPMTAGGCGLLQATILAGSYTADLAQRVSIAPPKERTHDWQYRRNPWSSFYQSLTQEIKASEPTTNQVMEALVNDFIHRGSEMSNSHQIGLSPYWRWILSIYGPQILDMLGTFRFLVTELVPLQLIMQKYRQGITDEGSEA
jgi:Reverse transcriptase (RNA-dependent DNA polymerase)